MKAGFFSGTFCVFFGAVGSWNLNPDDALFVVGFAPLVNTNTLNSVGFL